MKDKIKHFDNQIYQIETKIKTYLKIIFISLLIIMSILLIFDNRKKQEQIHNLYIKLEEKDTEINHFILNETMRREELGWIK